MSAKVAAIDALVNPEAAPDLGARMPPRAMPHPVNLAVIQLHGACGYQADLTAALVGTLAELVKSTGQPDRLAAALQDWAADAKRFQVAGASSRILIEHNICRGKLGGIDATSTRKY